MARRRAEGERGFIITLELVLIFTILGIGLLVGIVAIRNALFVWWQKKQSHTVWVYDSTPAPNGPIVLGPARDFDEHEAPRLFFVDRSFSALDPAGDPPPIGVDAAWQGRNFRAFIGVRDDRFTSRHRIFYENSLDCGVTSTGGAVQACIVAAGLEVGDNLAIGKVQVSVLDGTGGVSSSGTAEISDAGGIGYLYPLQQGPSYGIGRDLDDLTGLPGTLYRETTTSCTPANVRSRWTSQTVTGGLPCEPLPAGATVAAAKCPDGADGGAPVGAQCGNVPPADPRCVVAGTCSGGGGESCGSDADCPLLSTCNLAAEQCGCPGTGDADPANNWIDYGANCCPPGTIEGAPGQCTIGNDGTLRQAVAVQTAAGANVLAMFTPPFAVNLPPDTDAFTMLDPSGVEGDPGIPTNTPYDPSGDPSYDLAPDGEASPP